MRLVDYIRRRLTQEPDRDILVDEGGVLSAAQVVDLATGTARALSGAGLPVGSTVAIMSDNCSEVCVLQMGINLASCAWTGLHPSLPAQTLAEVMEYLDVQFLFFQGKYAEQADVAKRQVAGLRGMVCIDGEADGALSLSEWRSAAHGDKITETLGSSSATAWVQHTGGPAGPCHGTAHSWSAIELGLANVAESLDADSYSRHLVVAPLTHAAGIFALGFSASGGVNIIHSHFDVARVDTALRDEGVTHIFLPPTALYALLDHVGGPTRYPALKCIVVAGAPVSPDRFQQAVERFGPVLYEVYGQTETLLALVKKPKDYFHMGSIDSEVSKSAGKAVRFAHVALLDDDGREVMAGRRGEIAVRTSMLMTGYLRKPEWTARTRRNGWHLTGDVGVSDEAGYITIVDRKREMVVSGSFNVFTAEVEACLAKSPEVVECSVFGIPDARWGEAVHAVVILKTTSSATSEDLILWSKQELGSIKAPKTIKLAGAEEVPRLADGSIDKAKLKAPHWEGQWRKV